MGMTTMRLYKVTDAEMLSAASMFANELEKNYYSRFTEYYASVFAENFITDFREAITYAESIPSDDVLIDMQAKETFDVVSIHKQVIREVRLARPYVEMAFDDNGFTMNQIGYNNVDKLRGSAEEARLFFDEFAAQMNNYREPLIAKDYPATKFDFLTEMAMQFRIEMDEQQESKNARKRFTTERIHALNHVWETMALIVKLKEFPLENDPVGLEIFTLPRPEESVSEEL